MSQLEPDQADRILFYTDNHTPCTQSEQRQKDLRNFAVMLNYEPDELPEAYQQDLQGQFLPAIPETTY
ncbi:hypothetical protein NX722_23175 [Endozoicomonas gorgoniicola]|uniref:Uncharacterized protein n=1 Tax=Endozoicomonas gorgoniicola TaxID=1234144 RepID=A0ABT3N1G9_9GAMM|nr:hypothetical protein [Endozoicomonas gorgoniicola]MCW7555471.1 hypothetical protein [Endozoicomonas gorgoniicola]